MCFWLLFVGLYMTSDIDMALHDNIKQLRELKQWSQEEMAGYVNMSKNGYAKIERGESKPNLDRLKKIAQVLDIDLIELIQSAEKGVVFLLNENITNGNNYYIDNQQLINKIEKLELSLTHKDELLAQKNNEIEALKEVVSLLKAKKL